MRYVAAYLLAVMGGNRTPSRGDLEKILSSVGIEGESDKFEKVIKELAGKDVKQVIEQGKQKLSTVSGGAVVAAPAASAGGSGGAAPAAGGAPAPAKKEEKKEEPKEEESDEDMGFGLFD